MKISATTVTKYYKDSVKRLNTAELLARVSGGRYRPFTACLSLVETAYLGRYYGLGWERRREAFFWVRSFVAPVECWVLSHLVLGLRAMSESKRESGAAEVAAEQCFFGLNCLDYQSLGYLSRHAHKYRCIYSLLESAIEIYREIKSVLHNLNVCW